MARMNGIVVLENEQFTAMINVRRGANCISFRSKKYNAKFLREPDYSKGLDNPFLYGMPILFPPNRISGTEFIFEDRIYKFPLTEENTGCHMHGLLHEQEFQIMNRGTDFISCVYRAEPNALYPSFPHAFEIILTYKLTETGLRQTAEIHNLSSENMPNMLGFHTTFNVPYMQEQDPDEIRVMADVIEEIERDACFLPTGCICGSDTCTQQFRMGQFYPHRQYLSRHYGAGEHGKMYLWDETRKVGLVYDNDAEMKYRLILNNAEQGFICMEPQNCMVDCANNIFGRAAAGFQYIEPYGVKVYSSMLRLAESEKDLQAEGG